MRNRIAALDVVTGAATSWSPNANNSVSDLEVNGGTVYAGGAFNNIGGQSRNYIAALDAVTGAATSWDPNVSSSVSALAVNGDTVYAGGNFTIVGTMQRQFFVQFGVGVELSVTGVSPFSGPLMGGTIVTVTGTGFVSGAMVSVGGLAATNVTFVNATTLRATTSAGASTGAKDVVVTDPDTRSATLSGAFQYLNVSVTGVSPTSGPLTGGTIVTITGTNFISGATVSVGALAATNVTFISSTTLTVMVPAGASSGARNIVVTNPDTECGTLAGGFTYVSDSVATDLSGVRAFPMPFDPGSGPLTIDNLTAAAQIRLYSVAGELVKTVLYESANGRVTWDGRNENGSRVASGVYLMFIKSPEGKKTIKIAVER